MDFGLQKVMHIALTGYSAATTRRLAGTLFAISCSSSPSFFCPFAASKSRFSTSCVQIRPRVLHVTFLSISPKALGGLFLKRMRMLCLIVQVNPCLVLSPASTWTLHSRFSSSPACVINFEPNLN